MVEMAANDKGSRLAEPDREKLRKAKTTGTAEKSALFTEWRKYMFEDNVKAAIGRRVRYAGMGFNHLKELRVSGVAATGHEYDMQATGPEMVAFKALTADLASKAKAQ
jgi:hypothetical protein